VFFKKISSLQQQTRKKFFFSLAINQLFALYQNQKCNLHYTRFIHFRVSQVSGAHLPALSQVPHIKVTAVASRWQRVRDLIGSGFEPYTFRTRSTRRTTSTCALE